MKKIFIPFFSALFLSMPLIAAPVEPSDDEMGEETPASVEKEVQKKSKAAKPPLEIPADIPHELDVSYLEGDRKEKADLYLPMNLQSGQKAPALILIHGGGFNDGDKRRYREINFGTNAAKRGYLAMSINYKLRKSKGQVTWPQCIYDVKEAVRWLKLNADKVSYRPRENWGAGRVGWRESCLYVGHDEARGRV